LEQRETAIDTTLLMRHQFGMFAVIGVSCARPHAVSRSSDWSGVGQAVVITRGSRLKRRSYNRSWWQYPDRELRTTSRFAAASARTVMADNEDRRDYVDRVPCGWL